MNPLSAIYGRAARARRAWYVRRPQSQRRLARPVISVGNLVVGGSGKTPVVAAVAEALRRAGERPAILSRGYARPRATRDVVIVSDGDRVLESVARSGDEPQMLARSLPGVPVLVSPDRFRAGQIAQGRLAATVLLLDDGFQHLRLARDVDLLIVSPADLSARVLPAGPLREPLDAARHADAVIVTGTGEEAARVAAVLRVQRAFGMTPLYDRPRLVQPYGAPLEGSSGGRVLAVAGIARPGRFFEALQRLGWDVAGTLVFRDHHWFDARDLRRVDAAARRAGAHLVMTTEKDAVRIGDRGTSMPWAFLPMRAIVEPGPQFLEWLRARIAAARETGRSVSQP